MKSFPNIVLIVSDSLRADYAGDSTNINRVAEDGVLFENCYAPASWTRPSLGAILTGQYPGALGIRGTFSPYPKSATLMKMLKEDGYKTIAVVTGPFISQDPSLLSQIDELFPIECFHKNGQPRPTFEEIQSVVANELNLRERDKPVFVLIWASDTHDPYYDRFSVGAARSAFVHTQELYTYKYRGKTDHLKGLYSRMVQYSDFHLGKIVQTLKNDGIYDSTLLLITSDHGEGFGEHGFFSHRDIVYNEVIRVPLVVKFPESNYRGALVKENVSLVDIVPTVIEVCGLNVGSRFDGISLLSHLNDAPKSETTERTIVSECSYRYNENILAFALIRGKYKVIYKIEQQEEAKETGSTREPASTKSEKRWLKRGLDLVRHFSGRCLIGVIISTVLRAMLWRKWLGKMPLLYDLGEDPEEKHPLDVEKYKDILESFNAEKDVLLGDFKERASRSAKSDIDYDAETIKRLRELGYID